MDAPNLEDQEVFIQQLYDILKLKQYFDEDKEVHNNLNDLRKKYDFIKEEQQKKEKMVY